MKFSRLDKTRQCLRQDFCKTQVTYTYDPNGNVSSSTLASGTSLIVTNYKYDKNNQLTNISGGNSSTNFTYSENDKVVGINNKNGTNTFLNHDGAGQLTSVITQDANGSLISSYDYTFNEKGNIIKEKAKEGTKQFFYDKKEQLTKEVLQNGDIYEYSYDAAGNRISKKTIKGTDVSSINYTYDAANQLVSINGNATMHDNNGNLSGDGKKTYIYDAEDRLIEVKEGTVSLSKYEYNSAGLRISKTTGSTTIYYSYDENNNVVLETDKTGTILASYIYDKENKPVTMSQGGKTFTFHANGHGDITKVTDQTGTIVASFEYDSWGNILNESGIAAADIPFRYAGYRYDAETKLYYLQQRYYNPEIGRFITTDPVLGAKELPISQNGYAYADNNPVMNVDPNGMFSVPKKLKSALRYFITKIFDDFIENTLTNAVMIIGGGGIGAWTARKLAMKGFTMLRRSPNKKAIIGFVTGGITSYIAGNWFSKAASIAQYWTSKLWKYENWFDRNWLGKKIDNGLRRAKNYLLRRI